LIVKASKEESIKTHLHTKQFVAAVMVLTGRIAVAATEIDPSYLLGGANVHPI